MQNYANQPYYPANRVTSVQKAVGLTMTGGLLGMTFYYTPIKKDTFVQKAFDLTKKEADDKIAVLKNIAEEVNQNKVSTESKMVLQDMGLTQDFVSITNKCSEIDERVNAPDAVKSLKENFSRNFDSYKKNAALMDNTCAEAFRSIRWSKFAWGMGIGSAIGLALSLMSGKE